MSPKEGGSIATVFVVAIADKPIAPLGRGKGAVYTRQIKRLRQKTQTEKIIPRQTQIHCIPAPKKKKQ